MHVYGDVDCKETKEANKREKEKEGALRWNTCIIFTQPRNSALVTRSPELGKKSTKLSAYLRDIRASWVKNIENLLWKRIESSVRAFDLEWTLRECTYSRAIRNQTKKGRKFLSFLPLRVSGGSVKVEMLPRKAGKSKRCEHLRIVCASTSGWTWISSFVRCKKLTSWILMRIYCCEDFLTRWCLVEVCEREIWVFWRKLRFSPHDLNFEGRLLSKICSPSSFSPPFARSFFPLWRRNDER